MAHANPSGLHAEPPQKRAHISFRIIAIVTQNWDIRVSGTIVKSANVRVEEIALRAWGRQSETVTRRRIDFKKKK